MDVRLIIYDGKVEELRLDTVTRERTQMTNLLRVALREAYVVGREGLSPEVIPDADELLKKLMIVIGVDV